MSQQKRNLENPTSAPPSKSARIADAYDRLDELLGRVGRFSPSTDQSFASYFAKFGVSIVTAPYMEDAGEQLWDSADVAFSRVARVPIVPGRGSTADLARSSPLMGNRNFGFAYAQRCKKEDLRWAKIAGSDVPFEYQPGDSVMRQLLAANPALHDLIVKVGRETTDTADDDLCVVSFDSIKSQRNAFPKSAAEKRADPSTRTKLALTKPHIDSYEVGKASIQRRQMAFEVQVPQGDRQVRRALMYVPGSHTPEARRLLGEIAGKSLERNGFLGLPHKDERLRALLNKYAVASEGTALSIWVDGLVHFEAFAEPDAARPGCVKVTHTDLTRRALHLVGVPDPDCMPLVRAVCGTVIVQPQYIDKENWAKLMRYSEAGWTPSIYRRGEYAKGCPVLRHMVNLKSTQCGYMRELSEEEASTWPGQL